MMDAGTALMERGQRAGAFRTDVDFYDVMSLCSGIVTAVERRAEKTADSDIPPVNPYLLLDVVLRGLRMPEA
jgi:hypothetical protein